MTQIASSLQTIFDGLLAELRQIQYQPLIKGLSVANTLILVLVLVSVWCAISLSLQRLRH